MKNILQYENTIKKCALFQNMTSDEINYYVTLLCGTIKEYEKNEIIHKPWTRLNKFGLVLSGIVQACCDDYDGNRTIMAEIHEGVTFGESLCYLKITDSPVYIYASKDASVLWLSADKLFSDNSENIGEIQHRFISLLASRTLSMNNRIQVLSRITIREKLLLLFSQHASGSGQGEFELTLNREDMATYIGANRAALSRELSKMKKEGIIDFNKNTFIIK